MRVVIIARRERPITRPGQVEKVLDKFKIGPASYAGPGPISWMSTFDWSQNDNGSQIELEIAHSGARQAKNAAVACSRSSAWLGRSLSDLVLGGSTESAFLSSTPCCCIRSRLFKRDHFMCDAPWWYSL